MKGYWEMTEAERLEFAARMGRKSWDGLSDEERAKRVSEFVNNLHGPAGRRRGLRTRAVKLGYAVIPLETYGRLVTEGLLSENERDLMEQRL